MENIETLNERLQHFFGLFEDGRPNWRLSWSTDQIEQRFGKYNDFTDSGVFIRCVEEVRWTEKYPQNLNEWVLERLIGLNEGNPELVTKTSYEPIWFFGELTPDWDVCKLLIEQLYRQTHEHFDGVKYTEPEGQSNSKEGIETRLELYQKLLNKDDYISKKLAYDEAVVMPNKEFTGIEITDKEH